jgi:hypothetical protein
MANDGAYCKHGVNVFHPEGCQKCDAEWRLRQPVKHANGSHGTGPGEALAGQVQKFNVESEHD